jgi:lipopolysaccharide export system permease protein
MESFNTMNNTGYKFSIEKFEGKKLKYKMMSNFIRWDSTKAGWNINSYYVRKINGLKETLEQGTSLDTILPITPEDFKRRDTEKATMNMFELNDFIAEQKLRGETNISSYLIEKHQRIAFPFSAFILTLIGVSISSRKTRGGIGVHIGLGLIISLAYLLFMQISQQFSIKGNLSPALSAWIPNIIFAIIGGYLYKTAPK